MSRLVPARRARAVGAQRRLAALSPLAVLGRGYAIVEDAAGRVHSDAGGLRPEQSARLRMRDGRATITVRTVELRARGVEVRDGTS